jgi:hypothetical protein
METTQTNQVAVIENSIEVLKTGPQILATNQQRAEKALAVGRNILSTIQETGMTPELDERAKNYLVNINKAGKEMKEERAAVTQIMDELKKMYTVVENDLDIKKAGTVPALIQEQRDAYARQIAEEAEARRRAAEIEAAKKNEAIEIASHAEKMLNEQFNEWLLGKKMAMTKFFNGLTLETFDEGEQRLTQAKIVVNWEPCQVHHLAFVRYHLAGETHAIEMAKYNELLPDFQNSAIAELTIHRDDIIEKLPSKKAELLEAKRLADEAYQAELKARQAEKERLEAIAKANEAEKKKLEAAAEQARKKEADEAAQRKAQQDAAEKEKADRESAESARLAEEAAEAKRKADMDADIKKQGEQTMVMFEKEAAVAESVDAPETKQGYEITVLHPVGFTQIFALWFEKVGKDLPVDKIGNTKLDQMKAWAEKEAHKAGMKIDSKFLQYNETYKAVNRKAKA